jgi:hypothetical protein
VSELFFIKEGGFKFEATLFLFKELFLHDGRDDMNPRNQQLHDQAYLNT